MPIAEAQKLGAMALFGEKYGDRVRVIRFGEIIELCGGTHVANTGHIGSFRIVSEGAVAAGMRRIEAVTGPAAENYCNQMQDQLDALRELLKNPKDLTAAVTRLQEDNAALRAEIEQFHRQAAANLCHDIEAKLVDNPVVSMKVDSDLSLLKDNLLALRATRPDMAVILGSAFGDKPSLSICLGQEWVDKGCNAGTIVRNAGKEMQGGGGGQPAYATAGGKDLSGLDRAMQSALQQIQ